MLDRRPSLLAAGRSNRTGSWKLFLCAPRRDSSSPRPGSQSVSRILLRALQALACAIIDQAPLIFHAQPSAVADRRLSTAHLTVHIPISFESWKIAIIHLIRGSSGGIPV
jgi:hypothetical protein